MALAAMTWVNLLFAWYRLLLLFTRMQNHKQAAGWGFRWAHPDPRAGPAGLPREQVGLGAHRVAERGSFHH